MKIIQKDGTILDEHEDAGLFALHHAIGICKGVHKFFKILKGDDNAKRKE